MLDHCWWRLALLAVYDRKLLQLHRFDIHTQSKDVEAIQIDFHETRCAACAPRNDTSFRYYEYYSLASRDR